MLGLFGFGFGIDLFLVGIDLRLRLFLLSFDASLFRLRIGVRFFLRCAGRVVDRFFALVESILCVCPCSLTRALCLSQPTKAKAACQQNWY